MNNLVGPGLGGEWFIATVNPTGAAAAWQYDSTGIVNVGGGLSPVAVGG